MLYHEAADRVVIEVCRAVVLWPQALQACEHRARECAQTERRRRDNVRDMDWSTRQYRMQVAVYALYRRITARPWDYAVVSTEGKRWKVTKSVRGIGLTVFGRTLWLTLPMVIERELADEQEQVGSLPVSSELNPRRIGP
jgi:hypothetical protein